MNTNSLKDQWTSLKPKIKAKWPKLTEADVNASSPSCEWLAGKLKERYGVTPEDAKRQVDQFCTENNIQRDANAQGGSMGSSSGQTTGQSAGPSSGQGTTPAGAGQAGAPRTPRTAERPGERESEGRTEAAE